MKNILAFIGGLIVLCIVLSCIVNAFKGTSSAPSASSASSVPNTSSSSTDTPVATHGIDEEVFVGDTSWRVNDASLASSLSHSGFSANPHGKFLLVKATVMNNSKTAQTLMAPTVVDAAGREFETSSDVQVAMANAQPCALERLNPGTSKDCVFVYDVPSGTDSGLILKAADLGLFGKTVDIALASAK
ncbi:MAG: DUF4352 domain-containing protein [Chloroflexales bacterium]|jgi:Domain of unknown function (DUF4352)